MSLQIPNPELTSALIRHRRTVKPSALSDQPIDASIVREILENANWAPTHGMTEPWRFVVFSGAARNKLGEFLSTTYKSVTPPENFKPKKVDSLLKNPGRAPWVIAICMKRQETQKIPEIEEIEAVACAVQNMHLTATSYGIGGFWSSNAAVCSNEMRDYLGLPESDRVLGLFYLGYPSGEWPTGSRQPIEDKVTWRSE